MVSRAYLTDQVCASDHGMYSMLTASLGGSTCWVLAKQEPDLSVVNCRMQRSRKPRIAASMMNVGSSSLRVKALPSRRKRYCTFAVCASVAGSAMWLVIG